MARGRLIAFEGGEACGKSTQAARLAARTGALLTREPGGTPLGEALRHLVLDHGAGAAFDIRAETLVMLAARAQHVAEVVAPALDDGRDVVTDRFSHSTLAYQGYGRGLDVEELRLMCTWAAHGIWPDAVVLLDVPPEVADTRRDREADRLESAGRDFHDRVAAGFRDLAGREPDRWVVADGTGTIGEVEARVAAGLARMGIG
ncbi:MAG TPA: dTMP kinase [Acidimicrobiales bacterium]|nr:dTMP kinase [Acidimicrobiales bacterium]